MENEKKMEFQRLEIVKHCATHTSTCNPYLLLLCLQCIPQSQYCDGFEQCNDGADERLCDTKSTRISRDRLSYALPLTGVINFDGTGGFTMTQSSTTSTVCPDTHFQCPGRTFYCLPVYVICNGVNDCPGWEDEGKCSDFVCPGFYRCRASHICLHPSHLCDGVFQCPQHDDEIFCNVACPDRCTCYGNTFFCTALFPAHFYPDLRYLEARGSNITPVDVTRNTLLIHLGLAFCGISAVDFPTLSNLKSLDLSDNELTTITTVHLIHFRQLKTLRLAGNPLATRGLFDGTAFPSLNVLDVSRVAIRKITVSMMKVFPNLLSVNLSNCNVETVSDGGFRYLSKLRVLDLRGCPMLEFSSDIFQGLEALQRVYADNYKLCCPDTLPIDFNINNCLASSDHLSSCENLLRSNVYRILLAGFGTLSLLGNFASFIYRIVTNAAGNSGFGVFVTHLCVSDFLMGTYLGIIGVADRLYQGTYLWKDTEWKGSAMCQLAGFLSLLSSEVSAFIICLITLDRFLVLRFPFSQLRFHSRSAHVACVLAWCAGLVLAAVPLLPFTSHWNFYGQTGICIPLPVTNTDFAGQQYTFNVMIVLNFALFLLIAVGQIVVYWAIRSNSMSSMDTSRKSKDLTIARRLMTIVVSDFLCWFPIGVLGLLASNGVAISGEVNVMMAIIALPLNSALNPFLYTVNIMLERRRRAKEDRLKKKLKSSNVSVISSAVSQPWSEEKLQLTYTQEEISMLLKKWISENLLSADQIHGLAGGQQAYDKRI